MVEFVLTGLLVWITVVGALVAVVESTAIAVKLIVWLLFKLGAF